MMYIWLLITIFLILIVLYFIYDSLRWSDTFASSSPGAFDQLYARDVQDSYELAVPYS